MKEVNEELEGHSPRWDGERWIESSENEETVADNVNPETGYPYNWPECPSCGAPALDGHITCGQAQCNEGSYR